MDRPSYSLKRHIVIRFPFHAALQASLTWIAKNDILPPKKKRNAEESYLSWLIQKPSAICIQGVELFNTGLILETLLGFIFALYSGKISRWLQQILLLNFKINWDPWDRYAGPMTALKSKPSLHTWDMQNSCDFVKPFSKAHMCCYSYSYPLWFDCH